MFRRHTESKGMALHNFPIWAITLLVLIRPVKLEVPELSKATSLASSAAGAEKELRQLKGLTAKRLLHEVPPEIMGYDATTTPPVASPSPTPMPMPQAILSKTATCNCKDDSLYLPSGIYCKADEADDKVVLVDTKGKEESRADKKDKGKAGDKKSKAGKEEQKSGDGKKQEKAPEWEAELKKDEEEAEGAKEEGAGGEEEKIEGEQKEEEGEGEEGGEEEEEISGVDTAVGFMLLGAVFFVMTLFTLVNHPDADMKFYAWGVISTTVSIFSAVLVYSMLHTILHEVVLEGQCFAVHWVGDGLSFLGYFTALNVATAIMSGALEDKPYDVTALAGAAGLEMAPPTPTHQLSEQSETSEDTGTPRPSFELVQLINEAKEVRERRTKSWSALLSHMSGFSLISFGGWLQHTSYFLRHPPLMLLSIPVVWCGFNVITKIIYLCREGYLKKFEMTPELEASEKVADAQSYTPLATANGSAPAPPADWFGKLEAIEKWRDEVYESENDIAGLSLSFLLVQCVRYNISGVMPDGMGIEEEDFLHPMTCVVQLAACAGIFAVLACFIIWIQHTDCLKRCAGERSFLKRFLEVCAVSLAMAFSWCCMYAAKWELTRISAMSGSEGSPNAVTPRLILSLIVSFIAYLIIRGLDKLADMESTGEAVDAAIICIINALGMLVGFSWEQSFDGGVETISELAPRPFLAQFAMACVVATVVVTPWRRYILTTVMRLTEIRKSKKLKEKIQEQLKYSDPDELTQQASLEKRMKELQREMEETKEKLKTRREGLLSKLKGDVE